ncbi:MAG: YceI family protein [Alphaproteobacteria bacterium]
MRKLLLALAALIISFALAQAKDWQIDTAQSKLGFVGDQNGEKFQGGFKKFDAQISFDPDHPDSGKITVTVDIASITTGDDERDAYLPQDGWFHTSVFPTAQFVATTFRKTGENAFEADGALTLKGMTRKLTLPFTLVPETDHWRARGHVILMRNDFSIGTGNFAGEAYVKHEVEVVIDLAAKPVP